MGLNLFRVGGSLEASAWKKTNYVVVLISVHLYTN
jgi:hypothetical protein